MHILADFGKYTGHSRILADGQARGPGRVQVLAQRAQRLLCNGPRLAFIRAAHGGFYIEETLEKELDIPVFHDDQHGTAIVVTAALLGALRVVKKEIGAIRVVVNGPG